MSTPLERLARVNSRATRKFSEPAVLNGRTVYGVYEEPYSGDSFGQMAISNASPTFICVSTDVSKDDHRSPIEIRGVAYLVSNLEPDSGGDTLIRLERA